MNKAFVVAKWEYLEKVKSKAFLIGLFVTPALMVVMSVLPSLFATQEDKDTKVIGILDQNGEVAPAFAQRMQERYKLESGQPNYLIQILAQGKDMRLDNAIADADQRVANNEIVGYCIVHGTNSDDGIVEYHSKSVGDFQIEIRIKETLMEILAERRAMAIGLDPKLLKQINVKLDIKTVKLSKMGEKEDTGFLGVFMKAYGFPLILFLLIVTSGQMLVRSVLEEKSNRIVEVLVSSCSSTELMAGKVLGMSGLGFTQMGFWVLMGAAVSLQFGANIIPAGHAALLIVYFVLGYLFYAAVFIAAGSPLNTEQEAQQVTSYLVMILIIPIVLTFPAMKSPDAGWLKVLTFIPFLTPTMMALRIPIQMPSAFEIITTILLMLASIYVAMVAAGRIFRVAILATGKSAKLSEIFRWIRSG